MTKKVFCDLCDKEIRRSPVYHLQKYDKNFWEDDSSSWFVFEYICNSCFKKIKELRGSSKK